MDEDVQLDDVQSLCESHHFAGFFCLIVSGAVSKALEVQGLEHLVELDSAGIFQFPQAVKKFWEL